MSHGRPASPVSPGWTIYVDYNDNGSFDAGEPSAVTAADGTYQITGIEPGPYKVREVATAACWHLQCSSPSPCYYDETFDLGRAITDNDFGNYTTATKIGMKFDDLDADGEPREAGEPGLAGLDGSTSTTTTTASFDAGEPSDVTAADGTYQITGIEPAPTRCARWPRPR